MKRNYFFAQLINKANRLLWWIIRPRTEGVKVFLVSKNKILLVRLTYHPEHWTYPGGSVDKNEAPEQAAQRECFEEVGIKTKHIQPLGVLFFDHEYKRDTVHIFLSKLEKAVPPIIDGKEVAEAQWFYLNNLPSMGDNAKKMLGLYHSQISKF